MADVRCELLRRDVELEFRDRLADRARGPRRGRDPAARGRQGTGLERRPRRRASRRHSRASAADAATSDQDAGGLSVRRKTGTAALALLAMLYPLVRRPILRWGATGEEASSRLPGDELLEDADGVSTRAITIDAPAASVWPWLAQMGPAPRGGAYTYDWIENLLGLDMHSVDRVLPEFQHPEVGDTFALGSNRMRLERVEPQHVLAWRSEDGNWVWTFVLRERTGRTRLISRNRFRLPSHTGKIGMLLMEPASLIMEEKMLRGIKQRAEGLAAEGKEEARV
jgi:hypothetical protein